MSSLPGDIIGRDGNLSVRALLKTMIFHRTPRHIWDINDGAEQLADWEENIEALEPGELVAPPATLDDIVAVLGDIHDLLVATQYCDCHDWTCTRTHLPVKNLSPAVGRAGGAPEEEAGELPYTPPSSGGPPDLAFLIENHCPFSWSRADLECACGETFTHQKQWATHLAETLTQ